MKKLALLICLASPAIADAPEVVAVNATQIGDSWRFDVTLAHPDTGWDHYADGWEVVDAQGNVLGSRPLGHPHVNEQPFTRSKSGIMIPTGMTKVFVRARDNVHGWYAELTPVTLN
jgi:hypothetical protein